MCLRIEDEERLGRSCRKVRSARYVDWLVPAEVDDGRGIVDDGVEFVGERCEHSRVDHDEVQAVAHSKWYLGLVDGLDVRALLTEHERAFVLLADAVYRHE